MALPSLEENEPSNSRMAPTPFFVMSDNVDSGNCIHSRILCAAAIKIFVMAE